MKHVAFLVLPVLALVGCGSLPPATDEAASSIDSARVEAVNRAALRTGVQVVWINMPQKKAVANNGS